MGTEKPDDNKGKGKSILGSNDPPGTSNQPASSTSPSILQSNDPNPTGTTAEFNDMDLTSGQNFTGDILHYLTIAGSSPAHGLGLSAFMAHSSSGQFMPSFGHSYSPRGIGLQIGQSSNIQPPVITNQTPILFGTSLGSQQFDPWGGTHRIGPSHGSVPVHTGNIRPGAAADNIMGRSHGSVPVQTGNILPGAAADNITGKGSIPQASNILGKRERESSLPVGSSKKIAISPPVGSMPCRGLNLNHSSTESSSPSSHVSSQPTYTESSSPPYDTDSQTPSSTESPTVVLKESSQAALKLICMLCKRDVNEQPIASISVLDCGHVVHDECLKKITPKDQAKNPPCIVCATVEP